MEAEAEEEWRAAAAWGVAADASAPIGTEAEAKAEAVEAAAEAAAWHELPVARATARSRGQ